MPQSPELVEAYQLIKAGQKQEAGRMLKAYLAEHQDDPQAWWLMAHAVTQPASVRRCLEAVLKLDPSHAKARALLDKTPADAAAPIDLPPRTASRPAAPAEPDLPPRRASQPRKLPPRAASRPAAPVIVPPPTPVADDDFPPDELVLGGLRAGAPASAGLPPRTTSKPASFEEYLATSPAPDPFTAQPVGDPFASTRASEDLFAPTNGTASASYDPFDSARIFDPTAYAKLGRESDDTAQAPGTGSQPDWGPGLRFVPDAAEGAVTDDDDDFDYAQAKPRVRRTLGLALVAVALFVVAMLILWYLDSAGWLTLRGDTVPSMTRMDAGSFTIKYPKGWDQRCMQDTSGYPVCGIANHSFYNEVEYFSSQDIDLGGLMADSIGMMFGGGDLPDYQISVIVMDVPRTSPSYDNGSWAKTRYEWSKNGWTWNPGAKTHYDRDEVTIDGLKAYTYEYTSEGSTRTAAWDVYIEHDGIMLWMRVDYWGPRSKKIPHNTIKAMIESINVKPVEEWSSSSS